MTRYSEGGYIESKPIGISLDNSNGTFFNTELVNNEIRLTKVDEETYNEIGEWLSSIIDIGDNFREYGKLLATSKIIGNSSIDVFTRTSADSIKFNNWTKVLDDGTIESDKNRYIQVKVEFYAAMGITDITLLPSDSMYDEEFIDTEVVAEGKYIVPVLTSNTSSDEGFPFASSESQANIAWRAFTPLTNVYFATASNNITGYLGFHFNNSEFNVSKYLVRSGNTISAAPKDWFLEGSNDTTNGTDGTWDILDTQVNQIFTENYSVKVYDIEITKKYKAFRLRWITNNGLTTGTRIGELNFYTPEVESLVLKNDYEYDMIKDESWVDEGSLYNKKINRKDWLRFDKINTEVK